MLSFERFQPLKKIERDALFAWVGRDAGVRVPALASWIPLFAEDDAEQEWSSEFEQLLALAPDKRAFLARITGRFSPTGWSGSLADILEARRRLLETLRASDDPVIAEWAAEVDGLLAEQATEWRRRERREDETFE